MNGKDLIIYILQNGLENEPIFKDGKPLGFITMAEAAVKFKVGVPTIYALVTQHRLDYVRTDCQYLISDMCEIGGINEYRTTSDKNS